VGTDKLTSFSWKSGFLNALYTDNSLQK